MSVQKTPSGESGQFGSCISPENISAELDGEYQFSKEELLHLQNCPKCRTMQQSYREISHAVARSLHAEISPETQLRIQKKLNTAVETASQSSGKLQRVFAWTVRIAATLALLGIAGYLLYNDKHSPASRPADPFAKVPLSAPAEKSMLTAYPGGVDIRSTQLASTGSSVIRADFLGRDVQKDHVAKAAVIPAKVKQVWLYDPEMQKDAVITLFKKICSQVNLPMKQITWKETSGHLLRFNMELTRSQAVQLVQQLAAQKFKLISPVQPQPEQRFFTGSGRELVDFELVFSPDQKRK